MFLDLKKFDAVVMLKAKIWCKCHKNKYNTEHMSKMLKIYVIARNNLLIFELLKLNHIIQGIL